MRVLVVDDNALMRKMIGDALEAGRHDCEYAENGTDAIRLCLGRNFDVIVTDLVMPVLDGFRFIARIRAGGRNSRTPVVVVSARTDREAVTEAKNLGIHGFVLKPVNSEILLEHVRVAAGGRSPQSPAGHPAR